MKKCIIRISIVLFTILSNVSFADDQHTSRMAKIFTVSSGAMTGVYYPLGREICNIYNKYVRNNYICKNKTSEGPLNNIQGIISDEYQFAIVDQKILSDLYHSDPKYKKIKLVLNLFPETYVIIAKKDSAISTIEDLKGKKINIGRSGSGTRKAVNVIFDIFGFSNNDFALLTEESIFDQGESLCNNKIDAAIYVIGHPNATLHETMDSCETKFIPIDGKIVNDYIINHKQFSIMKIPALYSGNKHEVTTIGVNAVLITNENTSRELVKALIDSLFDHFQVFQESYPAFKDLIPENMKINHNEIPLHDALK